MPKIFKLVEDFNQFLKLRQPWNELVEQCEVDHAFMKHEWFECWVKNLGRLDNLMISTAWLDGQLMAVAPMQIVKEKFKGLSIKALCFLSSGISPRCNFIVHDSFNSKDLFNNIFKLKGCGLIITRTLEEDLDITKKYFEYLDYNNNKYIKEPDRVSPYLVTKSSWDDYWKTLSKSFRTNLNTGVNRLNRDKSYNVYKITDYERFAKILDQLIETSLNSWKGQAGSDLKSTPELLSFYTDFTRKASDMGLFELWVLEIDGQIVAFDYHLKGKNTLSLIRTDFDLKYKFYNTGNTIKLFVLKDLFNRPGIWEYDMGGHAVIYKLKWTNEIRKHSSVMAANSSLYGKLIIVAKAKVWPYVQRLLPGVDK